MYTYNSSISSIVAYLIIKSRINNNNIYTVEIKVFNIIDSLQKN